MNTLDEAAKKALDNFDVADMFCGDYEGWKMIDMFKAGAEYMKQLILENSTEIKVNRDFLYDIKQYIHEKYLDYKVGEKIRIALIKENDESE